MKDDAIAHLSDQLVSLSARLQELERRQLTAWRIIIDSHIMAKTIRMDS